MTPIKVDIWSDVQCPWCYIGKRKFEAAVEQTGIAVEVEYHSFELAPDTPVDYDGTPERYLAERKGLPEATVTQMIERVAGIARSVGLEYDYAHMHQTNTVKAHELLHYAKTQGLQLETKEALLRAYFIDGGHVGRIDDLVELAAGLGMDAGEVRAALETERHLPDVKADMAQATAYGIQGVPFFVFEGQYGVSGAQESATFANVLQQVHDAKEPAA